ncbi:Uncharacterized protein dnm_043010 [Desulfonema magnum]|uniref:Uncharacterized protein n=1 Tax=Desulfonema magnum TaxID=45655 RepID=A0A975GNY3_9BACT|nr:Uncharacterized protein dnm_043010 [Desulfonema magnum]
MGLSFFPLYKFENSFILSLVLQKVKVILTFFRKIRELNGYHGHNKNKTYA